MLDNKYVIKNMSNGKFLSSGRESSYTNTLQYATLFDNYDEAKKNCCGNETPIRLDELFENYRNW